MQSFLDEVVQDIWQNNKAPEDLIFVLPSKRAGSFLKSAMAKIAKRPFFSPKIYSTETFVAEISGLSYASSTVLLFELYHSYLQQPVAEKESFYNFSKWGQMLLQDFNEVDRYLVPPAKIFSYLSAIQELNHWYLQPGKTPMMEDYIRFWNSLEKLYLHFTARILSLGQGHQGLVYRTAVDRLPAYLDTVKNKRHIFVGFNALNAAEDAIIQQILEKTHADIYWDSDPCFIEDTIHDAGYFLRQHQKKWPYFQEHPFKGLSNCYKGKKEIRIIGVPKKVSQVKYVGQLLRELGRSNPEGLQHTAVVLGDEALLNPLLNAIPEEINKVNITMGYPIDKTPMYGLFTMFFELYLHQDPRGWYARDVLSFLSHNFVQMLYTTDGALQVSLAIEEIKKRNWVYIDLHKIKELERACEVSLSHLFFSPNLDALAFINRSLSLIAMLKLSLQEEGNDLDLEYLYRFYTLFNQLHEMLDRYPFANDIRSLYSLFKELKSTETVDFRGEPLEGLQIMGMLESRNLDFETVIITSVNEGILPSGKSNNSFIPFDVKRDFGLPTYKEKDAVYAYHFYRLLQRASQVYILYNTEADVLEGGEKSRFINQLLTDGNRPGDVVHIVASPELRAFHAPLQSISKDEQLLTALKAVASSGFSPTSLSNYIRNPIDFYQREILKIREAEDLEETVAANTFGTIIHDALETLYQPFKGCCLEADTMKQILPRIEPVVKTHFTRSYSRDSVLSGKNLIAFHVVVRYIRNFIQMEINSLSRSQVKIIALEVNLRLPLHIPGLDFPVLLKGKLDRIDEVDGNLRIVDYKTGFVKPPNVEVYDWELLTRDYECSKAFQLLCYALLYSQQAEAFPIQAGIFSFKNLGAGWLPFATKEKKGSRAKETHIDGKILEQFREKLFDLIREICDPLVAFTEKEV